MSRTVAIIGAGPAGCMCAYLLQDDFEVTLFDCNSPLKTLLPTGGGRCNLAHSEYDFKELAKNYPRGEKFLYSVFSRFSTADTLEFFEKIGVKTYTQDDGRIFPISNSAQDVREKFLKALTYKFVNKKVTELPKGFDYIIIATGGHGGFDLAKQAGHTIAEPKPALVGLITKEDFSALAGVSINNVLFTHKGVSGPEIYRLSSINARKDFPYTLSFDFIGDIDLQSRLNSNPHKSIKNLISELVPKSLAQYVLKDIDEDEKCHKINGKQRDSILKHLRTFEVTVVSTAKEGEVVTCGGVSLDEINPKTMQSKIEDNLYFCGEVIDVDGFCGGFNLQNCWSTAFIAAESIKKDR